MNNIEKVALWLAKQLDKLKLKSPIGFVFVQAILVVLAGLFNNGTLSVPTPDWAAKILTIFGIDSVNGFIAGVLVTLVAVLGVHTSEKLKEKGLKK